MKLSKKEEKRLRYRRNMPPRGRFELDFEGAKLFAVAHPWLHMLVCVLQWLSFLLPIAAYTLLTLWKEPLNGAWAVLSVLGALLMGMGLASLTGALRRGCWGLAATVLLLGSGLALLRPSLIMQYDPVAAGLIDQNMVGHYFATYLFLLMTLPFYGVFRHHIYLELRQTLREGQIRKWQKGMRNYWWYEEIQRQVGGAPQFGLNKAFVLAITAAVTFHALMGWNAYGATMTNEILRILCALLVCMETLRCVQTHRRIFGGIVLAKKDENGKWYSVFSSLLVIGVLALIAWGHTELLQTALADTA